MNNIPEPLSVNVGGRWTVDKLDILEKYLNAYTTALKKKPTEANPFKLVYIDAFAGTGEISLNRDYDERDTIEGSARRAIKIRDKPFDRLIFIERDSRRYARLEALRKDNRARDIWTENADANVYLRDLRADWRSWRGVLLLDPFATEVEWTTIEKIASFNALDTWILFPVSAVARMMPVSKNPEDISRKWSERLTRVFGDESWKRLYSPNPQQSLFGDELYQRDPGTDGIIKTFRGKLESLFGRRFVDASRTFVNSQNSPLFEFMFCVGHERGVPTAKKIVRDILKAG